jgi:hypothetical protein
MAAAEAVVVLAVDVAAAVDVVVAVDVVAAAVDVDTNHRYKQEFSYTFSTHITIPAIRSLMGESLFSKRLSIELNNGHYTSKLLF